MNHSLRSRDLVAGIGIVLMLVLSGCARPSSSLGASEVPTASSSSDPSLTASPSPSSASTPSPTPTPVPQGPPMLIQSIAPLDRTTVGVAMPISIVFSASVNASARKGIEQHITLASSTPVAGAWHWFGDRRVDFRPTTYWSPGTTVSMVANFTHVGDGNGRYGTAAYTRTFTIGDDVETHVYVDQHKTVVTENGQVVRTMLSDAGNPTFPTWDGTMAVVGKAASVRMTSCSVGIACNPKDPNFYDLTLPWDVQITWSGTYLHYSTGDPHPGHSYGSHGCVHLSLTDAQWFYNLSKPGDPVTITGSPRGLAAGDNGYADYNVSWSDWLAGSAMGQFSTSV